MARPLWLLWLYLAPVFSQVVTLPSGVSYNVVETGDGPSPELRVRVDYAGIVIATGNVFDSAGNATLMLSTVVPGWREALLLMKPGDRWEITIPSDLAFGTAGIPALEIPPNADVRYDTLLLESDPPLSTRAPTPAPTAPPPVSTPPSTAACFSLCPPAFPLIPDAHIPSLDTTCGDLVVTNDTCVELQNQWAPLCCQGLAACKLCDSLEALPDGRSCRQARVDLSRQCERQPYSIAAICGCETDEMTCGAPFCESNRVDHAEAPAATFGRTCQELWDIHPFLFECRDDAPARGLCCENEALCPLECIERSDKVIPFFNLTCEDVYFDTFRTTDCEDRNMFFAMEWNWPSWCGCPSQEPVVCSVSDVECTDECQDLLEGASQLARNSQACQVVREELLGPCGCKSRGSTASRAGLSFLVVMSLALFIR